MTMEPNQGPDKEPGRPWRSRIGLSTRPTVIAGAIAIAGLAFISSFLGLTGSKTSSSANIWGYVGVTTLLIAILVVQRFGLFKKLRNIIPIGQGNTWWILAVILVCLSGLVLIVDNIIYNVPSPKIWHEAVVFTDLAAIGTFLGAAAACISTGVAVKVFRRSKTSTAENPDGSGMSEAEYRFLDHYMHNISEGKLGPDQTSQIQAMIETLRSSGKSETANGRIKTIPGTRAPSLRASDEPKEMTFFIENSDNMSRLERAKLVKDLQRLTGLDAQAVKRFLAQQGVWSDPE